MIVYKRETATVHANVPTWFSHDCRICLQMRHDAMRAFFADNPHLPESYNIKKGDVIELPDGNYAHVEHTAAQYDAYIEYLRNLHPEVKARLRIPGIN